MEIRKAKETDCVAISNLIKNDLGVSANTSDIVKEQFSKIDKKREEVFVAEKDGSVIGVIHVEIYNTLLRKSVANVLVLAVSSSFRHQKVGSTLLKTAELWSKEKNVNTVRICSGSERLEAHKFYRAQGYNKEKEQIRFLKDI